MTDKFRFEERLFWLKKQTKDELKWEDEYLRGKRDAYLEEIGIIELLQANYAPRIGMTPAQYKQLQVWRNFPTWTSLLLDKFNNGEVSESLPSLSEFEDWGISPEDEQRLLTAWYHPETIINSETGNLFVEE